MAKDLRSLIRLHRWRLDEERRKLAELLAAIDELERRAVRLEEDLRREQGVAAASPEVAGFLYGAYAVAVIAHRHQISQSIARTEEGIAAARDALADARGELKKYELTQANREKRRIEELAHKEQTDLDEVGIQGFRQRRR